MWGREKAKAIKGGVIPENFRAHDMKVKGVSDIEGNAQYASGHKTSSMAQYYNHTPDLVPTVGSEAAKEEGDNWKRKFEDVKGGLEETFVQINSISSELFGRKGASFEEIIDEIRRLKSGGNYTHR